MLLPSHRRGNWIALKLRKLIKPAVRDQGPDRSPTSRHSPQASQSAEPLLFSGDSSFIGSGDSGGSSSTKGGAISPRRNSSEFDLLEFTRSSPIDSVAWVSSRFRLHCLSQESEESVHVRSSPQAERKMPPATVVSSTRLHHHN